MKTKFLSALACCALLAGGPAVAQMESGMSNGTGLFLEPGVSYQSTSATVDYGGGAGNSSAVTRGFGLLVRGGVHVFERFFVAADGRYAFLKFTDNSNNLNADAASWDIAPTVGIQMADWGARLYVGYVLAGNLDPKSVNGVDVKFENPTGWRVGAGLKARYLSVNIEWQRLLYGDAELNQTGAAALTDVKYNTEGLLASVTFPIEFN